MTWFLTLMLSSFVGAPVPDCMIVEFTSDNCGPCKQLQPALDQLKREGWVVRSVNVAHEPLIVRKFAIESLPTLVLISSGKEVDRIVGAAPYEKILPRLAKLLLSSYEATQDSSNPASAPVINAASSQASPRSTPARTAAAWQSAPPTQLNAPVNAPAAGITVRGQSPSSGAFPMLAVAASSALAAPSSQAIADKFNSLASSTSKVSVPITSAAYSAPADPAAPSAATLSANRNAQAPQPLPTQSVPPRGLGRNQTVAIDLQQAIARAAAATVRIRVDEENSTAYGTGTVIDVHGDEALVLTCGHLFREMKPHSQLTVDLFAGRSQPVNVPAQLIDFQATPGAEDIGLLSFRLPDKIEPVPLLPQAEELSIGQPAFSFGCDHGDNPTRRDTTVKNINRYLGAANLEISGAPAVGRSGGGLFDHQGRLIGVCNAADAASDEGIYAAAALVYTQIERLGLNHLFNKSAPAQDLQVQRASHPVRATEQEPLNSTLFAASAAEPNQAANPTPSPQSSPQSSQTNFEPASQLICIVRDSAGGEQVVTIDSPTTALMDAIQRQVQR